MERDSRLNSQQQRMWLGARNANVAFQYLLDYSWVFGIVQIQYLSYLNVHKYIYIANMNNLSTEKDCSPRLKEHTHFVESTPVEGKTSVVAPAGTFQVFQWPLRHSGICINKNYTIWNSFCHLIKHISWLMQHALHIKYGTINPTFQCILNWAKPSKFSSFLAS